MNEIRDLAKNPRQDKVNVGLPDTGHWIYEHTTYMAFSNSSSSCLVCVMGCGGSGKSTLSKQLLEGTRLRYSTPAFKDMIAPMTAEMLRPKRPGHDGKSPATAVAAFFYQHSAKVPSLTQAATAGNEHINMLCSLLYQIFWQLPSLFACWKEKFSNKHHPRNCSFDDLQGIFYKLRDYTGTSLTIHMYIDALNESNADLHVTQDRPTRRHILNLLNDLRTSENKMMVWKIMLSTRDLGEDMICILPTNTIRITEHNSNDIDAVIEDAMQHIRKARQTYQPGFPIYKIANFESLLKHKAKGVILWVDVVRDLVLDRLRHYQLKSADLEELTCNPTFMHLLYKKMVKDLQFSQRPDMVKAWFQWGALAINALRVPEFKDAVALSDMHGARSPTHESFIQYRYEPNYEHATRHLLVSKCGGFLELRNATSSSTLSLAMRVRSLEWAEHDFVVEPAHHTVTVFLLGQAAWPFQIFECEAHLDMVERCTEYLQILSTKKISIQRNTDGSTVAVRFLDSLPFLPYIFTNLPRHLALIDERKCVERTKCQENIRRLFLDKSSNAVANCLLRAWAQSLSSSGLDEKFWSSCAEATARDDDAHVNSLTRLVKTATGLVAANALRSLLAAGLFTEKRVATVPILKALILSAFSSEDPRMQDVILFLSPKHDADSHALRAAYRTILHEALSRKISSSGIGRLIAAGADVNHRNNQHSSPLHVVADSGDTEILEILLRTGAEVDAKDMFDKTPLHVAVSKKHEQIVKLLLDHKARVDARTSDGETPMSLCHCMDGQEIESIRRLLVVSGAQLLLPPTKKQQGWLTIPIRPPNGLVERMVLDDIEDVVKTFSQSQNHLGIVAVCGLGGTG